MHLFFNKLQFIMHCMPQPSPILLIPKAETLPVVCLFFILFTSSTPTQEQNKGDNKKRPDECEYV